MSHQTLSQTARLAIVLNLMVDFVMETSIRFPFNFIEEHVRECELFGAMVIVITEIFEPPQGFLAGAEVKGFF